MGRRILNTYGPTEATVTCIWAELYPGKPVTIGVPLPTYTAVLLDDSLQPVPDGEIGEICVGGPGVARGYVNRPDLTAERFVPDPTGLTDGRIYRTGDLGRYTPEGEIEYRGRADSEVKVRGHRVDLQEIEGVLLSDEQVGGAVVALRKDSDIGDELAAYLLLADRSAAIEPLRSRLHTALRRQLPPYMVPDCLEVVTTIPMLPSGKADRNALPEPTSGRLVGGGGAYTPPATETERQLCEAYAKTLRMPVDELSVEANLFDDLGGHSLVAATLVSQLRAGAMPGTAELSILDLYAHPTVRALAAHPDAATDSAPAEAEATEPDVPARPVFGQITAFGFVQLISIYVVVLVALLRSGSPHLPTFREDRRRCWARPALRRQSPADPVPALPARVRPVSWSAPGSAAGSPPRPGDPRPRQRRLHRHRAARPGILRHWAEASRRPAWPRRVRTRCRPRYSGPWPDG